MHLHLSNLKVSKEEDNVYWLQTFDLWKVVTHTEVDENGDTWLVEQTVHQGKYLNKPEDHEHRTFASVSGNPRDTSNNFRPSQN